MDNTSDYCKLHSALQGVRVREISTGKIIPKYIIWERCGRAVTHQYRMHLERCHPGYEYLTEAQAIESGRAKR